MPKTNFGVPYCHATSKQHKQLSWHVLAAGWNAEKALGTFNSKWQSASQMFISFIVTWQYSTQELVFWHDYNRSGTLAFTVKMANYHGIIAHRTPPYKSHNAKRAWFVLVFDVITQWVYLVSFSQALVDTSLWCVVQVAVLFCFVWWWWWR